MLLLNPIINVYFSSYEKLSIILAFVLSSSIFASPDDPKDSHLGPQTMATTVVAAAVAFDLARIFVRDLVQNSIRLAIEQRDTAVPALVEEPPAQLVEEEQVWDFKAVENGGDGWCGFLSLAASLNIPVQEVLERLAGHLSHLSQSQIRQLEALLALQTHDIDNRQYDGIKTVQDLIAKIRELIKQVTDAASLDQPLPIISFWLDGLLSQLFEATFNINIIIVQPVAEGNLRQSNILTVDGQYFAFNHHFAEESEFLPTDDAPAVMLTFGGEKLGCLLAHYQQLQVNGHSLINRDNEPLFYQWLINIHLGDAPLDVNLSNVKISGSFWQDTFADQESYWSDVFTKAGLKYLKTPINGNIKVWYTEDQIALFLFRLHEQVNFVSLQDHVKDDINNALAQFPEGVEYIKNRDTLVSRKFYFDLVDIFEQNPFVRKVFRTVLDRIAKTVPKTDFIGYLDFEERVGYYLRSNSDHVPLTCLGEYTGKVFCDNLKNPEYIEKSDMYLARLAAAHPTRFSGNGEGIVVSAQKNGNCMRFACSGSILESNCNLRDAIIRNKKGNFRFCCSLVTYKPIRQGDVVIAAHGDYFLEEISLRGDLVRFCGFCTELINPEKIKLGQKSKSKILFCSSKCQDQHKADKR
ncbi:MAG: hypothetical protein O2897_00660 [bacterium]|nr:hypothetical protein [bacterium]